MLRILRKRDILIGQSHQTRKLLDIYEEGDEITAEKQQKGLFSYASPLYNSMHRRSKGKKGTAQSALQSLERVPGSSNQNDGIL